MFGVSYLMNLDVDEDIYLGDFFKDESFVIIIKMTPEKALNMFSEDFISLLGYDERNMLYHGTICYFEYRHISNQPFSSDELFSRAKYQSSLLRDLFENLWFKNDNSFFVLKSMVYRNNDRYYSESPMFGYSNSNGKYNSSLLMQEEVNFAVSAEAKKDLLLKKSKIPVLYEVGDRIIIENPTNYIFSELNRFERALRFLHEARCSSFQMSKIANYSSIFETLVVTSNKSVTKQIKQRVFGMLSKYSDNLLISKKKIEKIYNYRSMYIHGEILSDKEIANLNDICFEADMIARMLLNILIENKELKEMLTLNNENLERWFIENLNQNVS